MATNEERNNLFFDASGVARPAAEVASDTNSAQQSPSDGAADKPRRTKIDPSRFPALAAHRELKLPREPNGRPVAVPHVAPKDAEGNPSRDLTELESLHNTISSKAAEEYDAWKSEQPATSIAGPITPVVREHPTSRPSPSRAGDRKPSAILGEYERQHRILADHHLALQDVASRDPEMAALHSEVGSIIQEQGEKLATARELYSKGHPRVGNEQLLDLAKNKSLTKIHSMLRHPLMTELHPQGMQPNLDPAKSAKVEDEASRLQKETFRREGFPHRTLNTGLRQVPITPDLVARARKAKKSGEVGTANVASLEAGWRGTARIPKVEEMATNTVEGLGLDEQGSITPAQSEQVLPVNIPGTTRAGDARVGSARSTKGAGVGGTSIEKPIDPRKRPERLGRGIEGVSGKKKITSISGGSTFPSPESVISNVDREAAKNKKGKGKKGKGNK